MLLLDCKQAFDRVWYDGLIFTLVELKFPHYLIGLIKSYFSNRSFRTRVGKSLSEPQPITFGVSQWSKLSPSLFNAYFHDIPVDEKFLTAQYADDVGFLQTSKVINHCSSHINRFTRIIFDWNSQTTKIRAFNAIIRSICTYAIPIWGSATPNILSKLQGTYMRLSVLL